MSEIKLVSEASPKAQLISLSDARYKFRGCHHKHLEVDPELAHIQCLDCKTLLNPMEVLMRFCREQTMWEENYRRMKEEQEKLDKRVRCKCQHCGQMTRINP